MRHFAALTLFAVLSLAPVHAFPEDLQAIARPFLLEDEGNYLVWQGYDQYLPSARPRAEAELIGGMFGKIQPGSFSDTDATIKEFGKKYGKLMGIPDGTDPLNGFRKFREHTHARGKWIQYAPTKDKLDDLSSLMTYVFRENGMLCAVVGRWRQVPGKVPAGIDKKAALRKAQEEIRRQIPYAEITGPVKYTDSLVADLNDQNKVVRLTSVTFNAGQPPRPKRVLIVSDGTVLASEDAAYHATGAVFANDPETDGERVVSKDLPDLLPPEGLGGSYIIKGKDVRPDPGFADVRATSADGTFRPAPFDPDPSQPFAEVSVYHYLTRGLAKAREGGLTEAEVKPFLPIYYDHWAVATCEHLEPDEKDRKPAIVNQKKADAKACRRFQKSNAWFNPATMRLNFAALNLEVVRKTVGGEERYKHSSYEATTVIHEFGHWLHHILSPHHALGGVPNANLEARASAEGVADLFAALTCDDPVIGNYFLGRRKRDLNTSVRYMQVLPIADEPSEDENAPDRGAHGASLAFTSAYWKMKPLLGDAVALQVLIGAMRVCHLPARFKNLALAVLAMDQLHSPGPRGRRMVKIFEQHELLDGSFPR
jgi:hypothetical protein